MKSQRVKSFLFTGLPIMIVSFGLLWLGMKVILRQPVDLQDVVAYTLLSLVFGCLSGTLYALDLKAAFSLFVTGLIAGFFIMFWQFIAGMDGWGDLTGLIYLFLCAGIGLASGMLVQLIWYAVQKTKDRKR